MSADRMRAVVITAVLAMLPACDFRWLPFPPDESESTSWVLRWNRIAIDASGLDHTPVAEGEDRVFGEQLGPTRASRAMAIVHIAMFEAINAIAGGYESYVGLAPAPEEVSKKAAIAQAAHDALIAMFPSQSEAFDAALAEDLAAIEDVESRDMGILVGQDAAAAILAMRADDGSNSTYDYVFSDQPGAWRLDPLNPDQQPHGEEWHLVEPFVMTRAEQFRCPPPPALDSEEYAEAYQEAYELGGDGIITPTLRTEEQTLIGIYWAYDGTPSLCAPTRLYNQIVVQLAQEQGLDVVEMAHLLALVNVGMADAAIAIWEAKFFYNLWRPVTAIREADQGTGPTGLGDGNPLTVGDPTFTPLGAPASNLGGPNFTPPFPTYPSGHLGFGGACFQILRRYFGTDDIAFTFVSDELNGVTTDNEGNVRPLIPRSFSSLSEAEEENGQSRIYLGIHWSYDITEGIVQGNRVGDYVYENLFAPIE